MSILKKLKNRLNDDILYSENDIIEILKEIYKENQIDKNSLQKDLYIRIRIKELKDEKTKEDLYEMALNDYIKKSI